MSGQHPLDYLFRPRSVAVVGASTQMGMGSGFLAALIEGGFQGSIYPVNPKAQELMGLRCYPSLRDVPTTVDHVISSVPAAAVPQLVEDCGVKEVKSLHFFTAGFSETGDEERAELEQRVVERARELGIRIIGPNCMGLYVPGVGISFFPGFPKETGPIAMVSQSGANASEFVHMGALRGLRFSKVISYGNAADLTESDFFDYCAEDPETRIIASYIEGVKDGRRFLRTLSKAAAAKPVVTLKGGRTSDGGRAAHSHTGSLAGSLQVFNAVCRQAGALRVDTLEELQDVTVLLAFAPGLAGPRVGIVGAGGGHSVLATDQVASEGLQVPALPEETQERLRRFTPVAGTSVRNPIDTNVGWGPDGTKAVVETLRLVAEAPNVDFLLFHTAFGWGPMRDDPMKRVEEFVSTFEEGLPTISKPMLVAVRTPTTPDIMRATVAFEERACAMGLPLFPSIGRAARAARLLLDWRAQRGEG